MKKSAAPKNITNPDAKKHKDRHDELMQRAKGTARDGDGWGARYEPRGIRQGGKVSWTKTGHSVTCRQTGDGSKMSKAFAMGAFDTFDDVAFDRALNAALDKAAVFLMNGRTHPVAIMASFSQGRFIVCSYDRRIRPLGPPMITHRPPSWMQFITAIHVYSHRRPPWTPSMATIRGNIMGMLSVEAVASR
jgi:hypothetical protein